jgi:hypothetical protein
MGHRWLKSPPLLKESPTPHPQRSAGLGPDPTASLATWTGDHGQLHDPPAGLLEVSVGDAEVGLRPKTAGQGQPFVIKGWPTAGREQSHTDVKRVVSGGLLELTHQGQSTVKTGHPW